MVFQLFGGQICKKGVAIFKKRIRHIIKTYVFCSTHYIFFSTIIFSDFVFYFYDFLLKDNLYLNTIMQLNHLFTDNTFL